MAEESNNSGVLPEEFIQAARQESIRTVKKPVDFDEDIATWLEAEFGQGWQREVNGLLRFYMDTNRMTPPDAEPGSGSAARFEM